MEIKCLLVDDEHFALALLEKFIAQVPDLVVVEKCKSPVQALDVLQAQPIDLLFLDIQMPGMNGPNMLRALAKKPVTIFTTAYPQHALEAFELDVVDYLLKPFSFDRFEHAVMKAMALIGAQRTDNQASEGFLMVKSDRKWVKIPFADILYIEGWKEYVKIFTVHQKVVTLESLAKLETLLPADQFLRVHKSFIVANERVNQLEGNTLHIGLHRIPVARTRKKAVLTSLFAQ